MQIRTVAVVLAWIVVALLIINLSLRSELIWLTSVALVVIAVVAYFFPQLRKLHASGHTESPS